MPGGEIKRAPTNTEIAFTLEVARRSDESGHRIVSWSGSIACPVCAMWGPSPQTGDGGCKDCGMCEMCAKKSGSCAESGGKLSWTFNGPISGEGSRSLPPLREGQCWSPIVQVSHGASIVSVGKTVHTAPQTGYKIVALSTAALERPQADSVDPSSESDIPDSDGEGGRLGI